MRKYVSSAKNFGLSSLLICELERAQENKSPHITSCLSLMTDSEPQDCLFLATFLRSATLVAADG